MYSIDEINDMLDEIASMLPEEVFRELNGGVSLLPETKWNNKGMRDGLYTLGEYRWDQLGRYIVLYYGSIIAVHGGETREELIESLRRLLAHELTHHIESLAGERELEKEDERKLNEYRNNINR